jgi:sugar lactone lactonase YvrE
MNGFRGSSDVFYALTSGHCALNTAIAQESSKKMGSKLEILNIDPTAGIAGGELVISCAGFDTSEPSLCSIWLNSTEAPIVALGSKRVLALIPEARHSGEVAVTLQSGNRKSTAANFTQGKKLVEDLHPVANPAFDPDDGSLFVTRSGPRGEQLPVTLFRVDVSGEVSEFSGDIPNPTGIAFDNSGQMFVTSRLDGTVYRITPFKEAVPFARSLGVATGIAFDRSGTMYVGDRSGTIYKVNGIGEEKVWAQLEPSVSAYHLAWGPDDALYVTGPTVTSFDVVYRINQDGDVEVFYKGLGRPQGLAFDQEGNLYVAASLRGRRGIVRITAEGKEAAIVVTGMNLVGLAFSAAGDMVVASIDSVFSLPLGIMGTLVHG